MILEPGTVVADRFKLVRQLGEGAMGSVWLAQHTQLDVPCAIKFILGEGASSKDIRARFEREAKAAAALRSPHVVGILDHGVWNDTPYIAMEYLEGEDLAARLERFRRLPAAFVADVIAQVARALTKAHALGLVHRDLKPANIFLTTDDDREIAKVLDFGIAKQNAVGIQDAGTKTGALMGTPYFMSPEQVQGTRALDHRSDLWSIAVVVFQCLTGALPFESEALGDLLMKIMIAPLPVPSRIAPVPPGFDAWWAKAASRDPAARFQTAKELSDALTVALGANLGAALAASPTAATIASPSTPSPLLGQSPAFGRSPPVSGAHGTFALSPNLPSAASPSSWNGALIATSGTSPAALAPRKSKMPVGVAVVGAVLAGIVAIVVWAARPASVAESTSSSAAITSASVASAPIAAAPPPIIPSVVPSVAASSIASAEPEAPIASASASAAPPRPTYRPAPRPLPRPAAPASEPAKSKDLVRW